MMTVVDTEAWLFTSESCLTLRTSDEPGAATMVVVVAVVIDASGPRLGTA